MGGNGPAALALDYVRRLARRSKSSFYFAFLILPRHQREGIMAVYAFCRAADNAVDDAPDPDSARRELQVWREQLELAYRGAATHPIAVRIGDAAKTFRLPREFFEQVLEGVAMDIEPRRFATWEDLALYCDRVAGAVGRLSVRVFGRSDAEADRYAADLGAAFQLTNILRDMGPDASLGRFYLPLKELVQFGLSEAQILAPGEGRLPFLQFQAARARSFFDRAAEVGRTREFGAGQAMAAIYRSLLERVERAGFPAWGNPVEVPRVAKLALAGKSWLWARFSPPHVKTK